MVSKAPTIACDTLTLDLEDSVPPAEKPKGREMIKQYRQSKKMVKMFKGNKGDMNKMMKKFGGKVPGGMKF